MGPSAGARRRTRPAFSASWSLLLTFFVLSLLTSITSAAAIGTSSADQKSMYVDKSLPDSETWLTEADFARHSFRRDGTEDDQSEVDDSAMYRHGRFEGDIMNEGMTSQNIQRFFGDAPALKKKDEPGVQRSGLRDMDRRWPGGRVPYAISTQLGERSRAMIADAIEEFTAKTCIRFVNRTKEDTQYLYLKPEDGCSSFVGRADTETMFPQIISLDDGCYSKGIIIHELMHAIGFVHEQSRPDRDSFVTIHFENVIEDLEDNFQKYSLSKIDNLGAPYDYGSVMHYGRKAFSKNGRSTIVPKQADAEIGQRRGFSTTDIYKINKMYNCNADAGSVEPTLAPAVAPVPAPVGASCHDNRRDCNFLARVGHCTSRFSSSFMKRHCKSTCGFCEDANCEDLRSWCGGWASAGFCTQAVFGDYMREKCRKSCSFC